MFFKKPASETTEIFEITSVASPVTGALIFICEKCGKKLAADPDQNPARQLQLRLKEKIKAAGEKGKFRAAVTSCMDICPDKEVAIAISTSQAGLVQEDQFFTLKGDIANTADTILQQLRNSP